MRIPLLIGRDKKVKKSLWIEKNYESDKIIIPIGSDCHPAYILRSLNLRKFSLPFDWLNTVPSEGLNYVFENIENNFEFFLQDLKHNDDGYIISGKYPCAEFYHEKDLIQNENSRKKISRRINRFKKIYQKEAYFLYCLPVKGLKSNEEVLRFEESVSNFSNILSANQSLHIFFRSEENPDENQEYWQKLESKLEKFDNVKTGFFNKQEKKYGVWGDKDKFPRLLKDLNIPIKPLFPRIFVK